MEILLDFLLGAEAYEIGNEHLIYLYLTHEMEDIFLYLRNHISQYIGTWGIYLWEEDQIDNPKIWPIEATGRDQEYDQE